jgi:ribosomal protein L11 methyltransferase
VSAALFDAGAQGIQELDAKLIAHFPPGSLADSIRAFVSRVDAKAVIEISETPRTDWQSLRAHVSAHEVGAITVTPPWLAIAPRSSSQFVVVIEPAMAFGTGEHATTRGCLRLLQDAEPKGKRVADVGTGSAVLAIAAAKLGAATVVGIEIDPDALPNANVNVALNRVSDRVTIVEGDAQPLLLLLSPFDLIVANILPSVICDIFGSIGDSLSPTGTAILSGILDEESREMKQFVSRNGWRVQSEYVEDGWWTGLIARQ